MSTQRTLLVLAAAIVLLGPILMPRSTSAEVYELRTYTTNEGKLSNLEARFRDHTIRIFEKHGMESVGYWVPTDEPESQNTLIYILRHESREAAAASWRAFIDDPEWQNVAKESEKDGKILAKRPESVYMTAADYSPGKRPDITGDEGAVFELRIYKTNEGKLPNLDARFRDHTMRLFEKHGMQNVGYWHPMDEPDASNTLIYIIRHDSREAAGKSWPAFGSDPEWQKVAEESQKDGKILAERPQSTYMRATDFSAIQ